VAEALQSTKATSEDFVKNRLQMLPHDQNAVYNLK
jgi:hypothetical protein